MTTTNKVCCSCIFIGAVCHAANHAASPVIIQEVARFGVHKLLRLVVSMGLCSKSSAAVSVVCAGRASALCGW